MSEGPRVYRLRRCPKCGEVTERYGHCFVKGPPLIPQLDNDTPTEPCDVVVLHEVLDALTVHAAVEFAERFGVTDDQWPRSDSA